MEVYSLEEEFAATIGNAFAFILLFPSSADTKATLDAVQLTEIPPGKYGDPTS